MDPENYDVLSAGAVNLHCTCFQPTQPAKAVLFIVHGLGEHSGRYEELSAECVRNDIAVFLFDHRGHGRSKGKKGHAKSIDQLMEDTSLALMQCRSLYTDIPLFLFGHSMGGQVVASFLAFNKSREINGAIISSAWFTLVKNPPSWLVGLAAFLKVFIPSVTVPNGLDANEISSVPEEVALYKNDPLVHNRISLSLFHALYRNGFALLQTAPLSVVPVLICHGEKDKITSLESSRIYAEKLGGKAAFMIWNAARHEPHHDKYSSNVTQYYVQWIMNHISVSTAPQ